MITDDYTFDKLVPMWAQASMEKKRLAIEVLTGTKNLIEMDRNKFEKTFSVQEAAAHLGLHPRTIQKYISIGLLRATRFSRTGKYHIPAEEIRSLLKENRCNS